MVVVAGLAFAAMAAMLFTAASAVNQAVIAVFLFHVMQNTVKSLAVVEISFQFFLFHKCNFCFLSYNNNLLIAYALHCHQFMSFKALDFG